MTNMKFIFIGFFILVSIFHHSNGADNDKSLSQTIRDAMVKKFQETISKLIVLTKNSANAVLTKVQAKVQSVLEQMLNFSKDAQNQLETFLNNKLEQINKAAEKTGEVNECVTKLETQIAQTIENGRNSFETCYQNTAFIIKNIIDEIKQQIEMFNKYSENFSDEISNCLETTGTALDLGSCITQKNSEMYKKSYELAQYTAVTIKNVVVKSASIVTESTKCVTNALIASKNEISNLVNDMQKCV